MIKNLTFLCNYSLITKFVYFPLTRRALKMRRVLLVIVGLVIAILATMGVTAASPASAASGLPSACQNIPGKVICASKAQHKVFLVKNGVVKASGSARFGGRASDGSGPWFTREGTFRVQYKDAYAMSTLYHVRMPFFMAFSGGQGLHYSSEFAGGYPYSHGCVGLSSYSFARKAFNWAPVWTLFIVSKY